MKNFNIGNKILNTLKTELKNVMGSQLTKNYDLDKEPYMQVGLHQLWSVYRGKRRGRENQEASIFMLDKRLWDKKKSELDLNNPSPTMKDDAMNVLKKDPNNLMKLRHPSILNLLETPGEDEKFIVFITEPVEFSLACLLDAKQSKDHLREKIPSKLEIKCMILELLEALNFMHQNAKCVHGGLSPENLYVTKMGKLKIAGLNFCAQIGTDENISAPVMPNVKFNEFLMYPNLKFAAPEISRQMPTCS